MCLSPKKEKNPTQKVNPTKDMLAGLKFCQAQLNILPPVDFPEVKWWPLPSRSHPLTAVSTLSSSPATFSQHHEFITFT